MPLGELRSSCFGCGFDSPLLARVDDLLKTLHRFNQISKSVDLSACIASVDYMFCPELEALGIGSFRLLSALQPVAEEILNVLDVSIAEIQPQAMNAILYDDLLRQEMSAEFSLLLS